ncbi:MAG: hypothetical protein ABSD59_15295 [Terracidiphilus sp.]
MIRKRTVVWIAIAAGAAIAALVFLGVRHWRPHWSVIQGAVIRSDSDARKQLPIAGVEIVARYGDSSLATESDVSGYFRIAIPGTVLPGQTVLLSFRQPGYKDLRLPVIIRFRSSLRELIVAAMLPTGGEADTDPAIARTAVSNIRVRYTENSETEENIGSAAKTFEVANQGNVPCSHRSPCSPDGHWKASTGSIQLDAGAGNEFRDARASCIAGPCPFTRIDAHGFVQGGRIITATALDWSDTTTFLLQAEAYHTSIVSAVRESYPVIYGRGLNFTLPPTAEGVSLVAELGGIEIVFPLGPDPDLSWASCTVRNGDKPPDSVYQCELKPGYRF